MRKLAVLGTLATMGLGVGVVVSSQPSDAQESGRPAPDSIAAPMLSASDTASLKGPRQPIFFRHDIHSGQFKIDCQYCHSSVSTATEPGIPTVQTCMGCHLVVAGSDSGGRVEIRKLRTFYNERDSTDAPRLEWVRVHTLARHAHFPHMLHVAAIGPTACGTCHGDVARMPQVWKVNDVNNMGFCINCHVERNVPRDCSTCHY